MGEVITIDCEYLKPRFAASYLLVEGKEAAFVETNTAHAVPRLLAELASRGIAREQVKFVIITHVHLDHAGGAQALLDACPRAVLLAHPRAAGHMRDPSKLVASARKVYGDETFAKLYGHIGPIPGERVREMRDGEEVKLGGRGLRFLYTRGHANHHFVIQDSGSEGIFTGDSFGLRYPDLQKLLSPGRDFVFPSTSPTDFDPGEAIASVQRIAGTTARRAFLTHFGEIADLQSAARDLEAHLRFSGALLDEAARSDLEDSKVDAFCVSRLDTHFRSSLRERGLSSGTEAERMAFEILRLDLDLNAAGIAHAARRRRSLPK